MCSDHAKSLESKIPRSLTKFVAGMMFPLKIVGDHIGRHGTEVTVFTYPLSSSKDMCRQKPVDRHFLTSICNGKDTGSFRRTIQASDMTRLSSKTKAILIVATPFEPRLQYMVTPTHYKFML